MAIDICNEIKAEEEEWTEKIKQVSRTKEGVALTRRLIPK